MVQSKNLCCNKKSLCTEITFTLRKNGGYVSNGIGGRSFPVDRQAGWLAGRLKSHCLTEF